MFFPVYIIQILDQKAECLNKASKIKNALDFFSLFSYFRSPYLKLILIISCQCQKREYRKMKQLFIMSLWGYLKTAPSLLEICSSSAGI